MTRLYLNSSQRLFRWHTLIPTIFVLIGFLVGCGTPNQSSNSTEVPSPLVTVIGQATRTPLPTATRRPSATPSLTPTINLTSTVIYQKELTAFANSDGTHVMQQTLVPRFTRVCEDSYSPRKISPNGLWMVEHCYSPNDQDLILTLSKIDSSVLWKLFYRDRILKSDYIPDGGLSIVRWSKDGRYAYVNSYVAASGGHCFMGGNVLNHGTGLFRIDLTNGNVFTVLPPRENYIGYSFSFAPTDKLLVYESHSLGVEILDFQTNAVVTVTSAQAFNEAGGYLWSPDGLRIVYSTASSAQNGTNYYSIRSLDARSGNEQILLESEEYCFAAREWKDDNVITIEVYDQNYDRILIEYDLNSKTVLSESTATATHRP